MILSTGGCCCHQTGFFDWKIDGVCLVNNGFGFCLNGAAAAARSAAVGLLPPPIPRIFIKKCHGPRSLSAIFFNQLYTSSITLATVFQFLAMMIATDTIGPS